jgi:hypothetical protein
VRSLCADFCHKQLSSPPCSFAPILTLRFAVAIKRSADPDGGQRWESRHFSSMRFASVHLPGIQVPAVRETIELELVNPSNGQIRTSETRCFNRPTKMWKGKSVERGEVKIRDMSGQDNT